MGGGTGALGIGGAAGVGGVAGAKSCCSPVTCDAGAHAAIPFCHTMVCGVSCLVGTKVLSVA